MEVEIPASSEPHEFLMAKKSIKKNLVVISGVFILLFVGYQPLANLQSSMNMKNNIGTFSQVTIYVCMIVSSMFLPKVIIRKLGIKKAMILACLGYCPYVVANFHLHLGTMIPASVILGVVASTLWAAKCSYINVIACIYSIQSNSLKDAIARKFFDIFFACYQSTQIWGNLVSYFVLMPFKPVKLLRCDGKLAVKLDCGMRFCTKHIWNNTNPFLYPVNDQKRIALVSVFVVTSLLAFMLLVVFLDDLKTDFGTLLDRPAEDDLSQSPSSIILSSAKHMGNVRQICLTPLTVFSGFGKGYFIAEYSRAFVACLKGIHYVGLVFLCYGVSEAVVSIVLRRISSTVPRISIIGLGFLLCLCMYSGMIVWTPDPDQTFYLFFISGIWGTSDAIWQTEINVLYSSMFPNKDDAASSNFRMFEALGFAMAFSLSGFMCVLTKTIILVCLLVIGVLGYVALELTLLRNSK